MDVAAMRRQLGDDDELIADVISLFLDDYSGRLEGLTAALDVRDAGGVRAAAHTIKGSATYFCAARVVRIAMDLEAASEREDFAVLRGYANSLNVEVERLADALRACQTDRQGDGARSL